MPTVAFALPILPGQTSAFRTANQRFAVARAAELGASRSRLGVRAELGFLQSTPAGDLAIVVFDVEDPARLFQGIAQSPAPLDVDFRRYLLEVFGLDLSQGGAPPPELVFQWPAAAS